MPVSNFLAPSSHHTCGWLHCTHVTHAPLATIALGAAAPNLATAGSFVAAPAIMIKINLTSTHFQFAVFTVRHFLLCLQFSA